MAWGSSTGTVATQFANTSSANYTAGAISCPAGDQIFLALVFDNAASSALLPTVSSISVPGGETAAWVRLGMANSSASTTGSGERIEIWALTPTTTWSAFTPAVVLSNAVTAKASGGFCKSGGTLNLRQTLPRQGQTSTTGVPSDANATVESGDLVIGVGGWQSTASAITADSDTTNGSWDAGVVFSSGGADTSHVQGIIQFKIPTATGTQTYNPTGPSTGSDAVCISVSPGPTVARLSRTHAEILEVPTQPAAQLSRTHVEVLEKTTQPAAQLSRTHIEVLLQPLAGGVLLGRPVSTASARRVRVANAFEMECMNDAPLLLLPFDESVGASTMEDWSGNVRNGTYNVVPLLGQAAISGPYGTSALFDGATSFAQVAAAAWQNVTNYTITAVIKTTTGNGTIAARDTASGTKVWDFTVNTSGFVNFSTFNGTTGQAVAGTINVCDGQPHVVAARKNGTTIEVWVDGVLDNSATYAVHNTSATPPLDIGRRGNGTAFYTGGLDSFVFDGSALSSTRMLARAAASKSPVTITLGRAVQTATARSVAPVQIVTLGRASTTNTARAVSSVTTLTIGRAVESDTATAPILQTADTRTLGVATESDTARTLLVGRAENLGRAAEAASARALSVIQSFTINVGRATEADTARPLRLAGLVVDGSTQVVTFDVNSGFSAVATDLVVTAMDKTLRRAPASLAVSVYGAEPDETLTFKIDGVTMTTEDADSQGRVLQLSIPVTTDVGAVGSHTVTVESATKSGSDTFTIALAPVAVEILRGADTDPVLIPEANQGTFYQWVLQDLMAGGLGSWIMPINPSSMTSPGFETNVEVQHSTSVETGQFHVWQVGNQPVEWQFSGYCPDQTFYEQLQAYAALTRRFYIIDHRNRAWKVAIVGLDMVARKRAIDETGAPQDWRHDYTVRAYIYEQTPGVPV